MKVCWLTGAAALLAAGAVLAGPGQQVVLDHYAAQARQQGGAFAGFSATRGAAFFAAHPRSGHPETPSCTTCHTADPRNEGRTRAGKALAPMAVSRTPERFTDLAKVEKWFHRNCNTVYGRDCTAQEKGDFIAFMSSR